MTSHITFLIVLNIFTFNGITISVTFGMTCHLYDKGKYVVYGNYGSPIGNHFITSIPKLPQFLQLRWSSGTEVTVSACCTAKLQNKQNSG